MAWRRFDSHFEANALMRVQRLGNGGRSAPIWIIKVILGIGFAGVLVVSVLWWFKLTPRLQLFAWRDTASTSLKVTYVGSKACRECHPGESALFSRSGHAQTLRPAAGIALARKLDGKVITDPENSDVRWQYHRRNDQFAVTRSGSSRADERYVIDYAFGSDHHATTFVSLTNSKAMPAIEHRLTHYALNDTFGVTPGQSAAKPYPGTKPHGREIPNWEVLACFRCHTTRTSIAGNHELNLDEMIPNVSCERCHGPASGHIAAARADNPYLSMPFGSERWTVESQMALCGKCHRHPSEALPGRIQPEIAALARFQPVGIMQSKCYQASNGAFSCVNCHDPHARASSDPTDYESACLLCHGAKPQTTCPTSPKSGCVSCHMPQIDTGQRVFFTDHWIRIRKASDPPAAQSNQSTGVPTTPIKVKIP